ncbi:MAG: phosphoheptose isomerase [Chitinophagaceae bacterium]|nr:MAG: phosphoheptose isomerase [Chitinophagaceae bacterium]
MRIRYVDDGRPWGGFLVIDEEDNDVFIKRFFPQFAEQLSNSISKLSPKILLVAPNSRLSWQYHHRRAEIWKVLDGAVDVVTSDDDEEKHTRHLKEGDIIELRQGERHRLVGLDDWGVIAEIWMHTDANNPSNEEDIVRVQDDFGR